MKQFILSILILLSTNLYAQCDITNYQEYYPDLRDCCFVGADLSGHDFSGANLEGVNFTLSNFEINYNTNEHSPNFAFANLTNANFSGVNLDKSHFYGANCQGADFSNSSYDLDPPSIFGANFQYANFQGANFYTDGYDGNNGWPLPDFDIYDTDSWIPNFSYADFSYAGFANVKFREGNFTEANFYGARFIQVEFIQSSIYCSISPEYECPLIIDGANFSNSIQYFYPDDSPGDFFNENQVNWDSNAAGITLSNLCFENAEICTGYVQDDCSPMSTYSGGCLVNEIEFTECTTLNESFFINSAQGLPNFYDCSMPIDCHSNNDNQDCSDEYSDLDNDGFDDMSYDAGYYLGATSGDVNFDSNINVVDIVNLVSIILERR